MAEDRRDVFLIKPSRFGDARGWFSETYNFERYRALGLGLRFVQDNHSLSKAVGVVRGLHFQAPPRAQAKLVSCIRGAVWDVCVDIRKGSPTYGKWVAATLSEANGHQLFVPAGFAHGFVTLEPDSQLFYKVGDYYSKEAEGGLAWDDPGLGIGWPLPDSGPILSDKDRDLPSLAGFDSPFVFEGGELQTLGDMG